MASAVAGVLRFYALKNSAILKRNTACRFLGTSRLIQCRNAVSTTSGAILPKPTKIPFGMIRIMIVVVPFLLIGTQISKKFAIMLEENDIFVPEDDDD
ncbi:essential MCU regulator, mitochondrial-like [Paramormyrops kingsleyae]|uniref:Essential MCU regulator, mitochondrial n=1 Tax=Paramormyrops kingsleyae TaxID=1676925 RepID=A0A3B3RB57_9TELE|nr:essential MCU regulator, mitochondrial-like [Paramormyrops kingsleyae]